MKISFLFLALTLAALGCKTTDSSLLGNRQNAKKKPKPTPVLNSKLPAYYTASGAKMMLAAANATDMKPEDSKRLRNTLWTILNSAHIVKKGQPDSLVKSCPKQQNASKSEESICRENQRYSYRQARSYMFGDKDFFLRQDENQAYYVTEVYCGRSYFADRVVSDDGSTRQAAQPFQIGPRQVPSQHQIINTEHTWPKSRFNYFEKNENGKVVAGWRKYRSDKSPGYLWKVSDLHHLLPTDSRANGTRGNYHFAEVNSSSSIANCKDNKLGAPIVPSGFRMASKFVMPSTFYEPPPHIRGDIARGLFYFSIRYDTPIHPLELYYLRKWDKEDPVTEAEKTKHNGVFRVQNNRNPFIDLPALSRVIDFTSCLNCTNPNAPVPPYEGSAGRVPNNSSHNNGSNNNSGSSGQNGGNVLPANPAANQVGPVVPNPCHPHSGKPYKKYAGFALMKTNVPNKFGILKFYPNNPNPRAEPEPKWDSVEQFMEDKGIIAACKGL